MYKEIYLPTSKKKEMEKTFGTTKVSLWNALTFKTNSSFAKMLRAAALQRGGVLYQDQPVSPDYIPNCETTHTPEKTMIQTFSERVNLITDFPGGIVTLYIDGEETNRFVNPTITDLSGIQSKAERMAKQLNQ